MLAVLHPGLELVGVTCVGGNTPLPNVLENTLRVFDFIAAQHSAPPAPVFAGCGEALARSAPPADGDPGQTGAIHGEHLDLPPATSRPQPAAHAVDFLLRYYHPTDGSPAAAETVRRGPRGHSLLLSP